MLILTRSKEKSIIITTASGEEIKITVLPPNEKNPNNTRLGFEADKSIQIDREEIWQSKQENKVA